MAERGKQTTRGSAARHPAASACARAIALAFVGASLLSFGCSIDQHGCARLRAYQSAHATLLRIDAIGVHLATGWGDRGMFVGACSRWAIFPAASLDQLTRTDDRLAQGSDGSADHQAIDAITEADRLRPIDAGRVSLDTLAEPIAWGSHAAALYAAWTTAPAGCSLGLGRRSRAVLRNPTNTDSIVLIFMGSFEDLDAGRAYARVVQFDQE